VNNQQFIYRLYISSVCFRENNVISVWFGTRGKDALKLPLFGAIHEVLLEQWQPRYVRGDQQCQGTSCNIFLIFVNMF